MPRNINPAPQYHIGGQPVVDGKMYYFEAGTNTPKATYADLAETIENSHPVLLDVNGTLPNVFFSGSAKQILTANVNGAEQQVFERDPVGDDTGAGSFEIYSPGIAYQIHNIVVTTDGRFWKSLTNNNIGNDPTIDNGSNWQQIDFNEYWVDSIVFTTGDIVIGSDNFRYISVVGSNLGNDPTIDSGANWQKINGLQDWVIGRTYEAMEEALGSNGRIYRAVIQNSGNDPVTDNGSNWLPAVGKVDQPTNVTPADLAENIVVTPTLESSVFSVTGGSDKHEYTEYQISTDATFNTIDYTSNALTFDLESHLIDFTLLPATQYYWRVKYKGEFAGLSEFSDITSFTTVPNLSEIFSINSDTGTGAARFTLTNVDLNTQSGSIWIFNRDIVSFTKKLDTSRGFDEFDFANNTPEATNAQGVTDYGTTGFTVGTDADYNGTGNTISSFSFQNKAGFHDTIRYTGNGTARSIGHNLNSEVGMMIIKNENETADANSFFYMYHKDLGTSGYNMAGTANIASVFGAATNTTFSLTTSATVNESGDNFIAELFAHNPAQGIFCGTYPGTGSSGLKITTGFPVGLFITVATSGNIAIRGTHIADIVTGTSSYILAQETGNTEQVGSVFSFDVDGVTLDGNGLNASGATYYFCAIADPTQF